MSDGDVAAWTALIIAVFGGLATCLKYAVQLAAAIKGHGELLERMLETQSQIAGKLNGDNHSDR